MAVTGRRYFSEEEIAEALELARKVGVRAASERLGISYHTLHNWAVKARKRGEFPSRRGSSAPMPCCVDCGRQLSSRDSTRCREHALKHIHRDTRGEAREEIRRQVAEGKLVIRQMTVEEREFWGPPNPDKRAGAKLKRQRSLAVAGATADLEDDELPGVAA